jgi:predicted nucleic acid-binding protein
MRRRVLIDTGPIVALLNEHDRHHEWVMRQLSELSPPLLTCEAVITEACFLADRHGKRADAVLELIENGVMTLTSAMRGEIGVVRVLMRKYDNVPMSFADACLVRMTEVHDNSVILTVDSDFRIYRKHGRQRIDAIMPDN